MSDLFRGFATQTQSALSSLTTLLGEHEEAMRNLDSEISGQDFEANESDAIYRMKVCVEKRAQLEQNKEAIEDNISQHEIMLLALARISQLEGNCCVLQEQLKFMVSEADRVKEQLDETRSLLEQSQEKVVALEADQGEINFLSAISSRAEAALTGSLETASTQSLGVLKEGGEDRTDLMHMDDSTESCMTDNSSVSDQNTVTEMSGNTRKQMTIISDYGKKGNYDIAVNLSKKALRDLQGDGSQTKLDRAVVLNTLALLYRDLEKPLESIQLLEEALKIREELHGVGHMGVASIANNLAIFYSKTRQYDMAEGSCKKALTVKESVLGVDSVEVAKQVSNLALICQSRHKLEESEFHFTRALDIYQTSLGPKDKSVLKTMTELGQCYLQQRKIDEAEKFLRQVVSRGEEVEKESSDTTWPTIQPIILQCVKSLRELYILTRNIEQLKKTEYVIQKLSKDVKSKHSRIPSHVRMQQPSMLPKLSSQGPSRASPTPPVLVPVPKLTNQGPSRASPTAPVLVSVPKLSNQGPSRASPTPPVLVPVPKLTNQGPSRASPTPPVLVSVPKLSNQGPSRASPTPPVLVPVPKLTNQGPSRASPTPPVLVSVAKLSNQGPSRASPTPPVLVSVPKLANPIRMSPTPPSRIPRDKQQQ